MKKGKALFISHQDDNSGAPKALYNILKFILSTYKVNVDVSLCVDKSVGVFEDLKNNKNSNEINVFYPKKSSQNKIIKKITNRINNLFFAENRSAKYNKKYDFVFFNSISFNYYKSDSEAITIPKYLYLHEGSNFLYTLLKDDYSILKKFNHIFVPSSQVEENLIKHGIDRSKITILELFVEANAIVDKPFLKSTLPKDGLVVGNLANLDPTKGIECFLATAKLYKELYPNDHIKFIWKGYTKGSSLYNLVNYEIKESGLSQLVFLEEKNKEIEDYFSRIDVLLLTSKQETFGLVLLEAANYFTPSITFKNVIGGSKFIDEYGGFTASYLSINQLVLYLKEYYENNELVELHGSKAHENLIANYALNERLRKELKVKLDILLNT
jgi:glycosyltransferase involved in cell wall biosynthesis